MLRIRGESIKYSAQNKKAGSKLENDLIAEIGKLELGEIAPNLDLLELKKQELDEIRRKTMQGHMVRSRMQWVTEGERPT